MRMKNCGGEKSTSGNSCQVFVSIWNGQIPKLDPCMYYYICMRAVPGEHTASKGNGLPHIIGERERAKPSRPTGSNFLFIYIYIIRRPAVSPSLSAHVRNLRETVRRSSKIHKTCSFSSVSSHCY